jgi:far upstream element-binding protein
VRFGCQLIGNNERGNSSNNYNDTSGTNVMSHPTTTAEEALARARAIATSLTGLVSEEPGSDRHAAVASEAPTPSTTPPSPPPPAEAAAEAALTMPLSSSAVSPSPPVVAGGGGGAAPASAAVQAVGATASATASTTTGRKRKRWGVAPPPVASAAAAPTTLPSSSALLESLPGLAEAALKKQKQAAAAAEITSKRIWVPTSYGRPETHFLSFLGDRLPDLAARVNADFHGSSGPDSEKNRIELGGRGAGEAPPPGMPLEPMHVMIHGSEAFIAAAVPPVEDLLAEGERAELEGPPPDPAAAGLAGKSEHESQPDYSTALTLTRHYHDGTTTENQSGYRPATVAQMISQNPGGFDPTLIDGADSANLIEEIINVPNGVVGFLIGRGGETISSMQARSGCKVQIQKEHELQPGQTHRVITLQATNQASIDRCRGMIESMVQDRIRSAGGDRGGGHHHNDRAGAGNGGGPPAATTADAKVNEALAAGHKLVTVEVPDADVGLIIGKAGSTIKSIQEATGSAVQIPPSGNSENPLVRIISITNPTEEGALAAKLQIENVLKSKPSYAPGASTTHINSGTISSDNTRVNIGPPQVTIHVTIPDKDVGLCIGRQGCVIREMQNKTGTHIQIPSQPIHGQPYRVATVSGTQEGCNQVRALIERIVYEQSSASVMGTPQHHNSHNHFGGGGYHRDQYQPNNNHPNTNATQNAAQSSDPAWQAYYAAQAVANKQQQQQQQQQQAAAAATPASDAYYEQFFRYAYYYGEEAARQYYGVWSPPHGTPNPYGTNPNGISPAPSSTPDGTGATPDGTGAPTTTVAAGEPTAASGPEPQLGPSANIDSHVRESSMRKVSNLPAWMTKS